MEPKQAIVKRDALEIVPVGRREPRTFAEAHAQLETLLRNFRAVSFLFARRLTYMRDHAMYKEGGFHSMDDYWAKRFPDRSPRMMHNAMAYADSIPGEVAAEFDPDKIDAGVKLLRTGTREEPIVTLAGLRAIKVRAVRDGKPSELPFAKATVPEIRTETKRRRRHGLPGPPPQAAQFHEWGVRKLGSGVTRFGETRVRRQGARWVGSLEFDFDHWDEIRTLFK